MHDLDGNPHDGSVRHHHERPYTKTPTLKTETPTPVDLRERRKLVQSTHCVLYHLHGLQTTGEVYCFGVYRTADEAVRHGNDMTPNEYTTQFEVVEVRPTLMNQRFTD